MPAPVNPPLRAPTWAAAILWTVAVFNVLAGAAAIATPEQGFEFAGAPLPRELYWYQAVAALAVVFGIGYGLAATNPLRHWPLVLIGLLSKMAVPAVLAAPIIQKELPQKFAYLVGIADIVWWIPLGVVLYAVWRTHHPRAVKQPDGSVARPAAAKDDGAPADGAAGPVAPDAYKAAEAAALSHITRQATLHRGPMLSALTLRELADKTPTLVVFLRHLGCTFCREALADVAAIRSKVESRGMAVVLVHMSPPNKAAQFFARYGLDEPEGVWHISDPQRRLYQAFELPRGKFTQLFGLREIGRGFQAGIMKGHFLGLPKGDGHQLGGVFVYHRRRLLRASRNGRASDRPDYLDIASCPIDTSPAPVTPEPASPAAPSPARRS